jgi:hypothetical protein
MMNKKYMFGGIVATVLVASVLMTTASFAHAVPSWTVATAATATQQNDNMSTLSVTAAGDIPRKVDISPDAVAGFAWADLNSGKVLVAVIHPTFRDSNQNPDSWHLHAAQLTAGVNGHNFCIDSFFPNPQGGISIQDNKMTVNLRNSEMPFATSDINGAVGFVVNPDVGCTGTGLAVDVTGSPAGLS